MLKFHHAALDGECLSQSWCISLYRMKVSWGQKLWLMHLVFLASLTLPTDSIIPHHGCILSSLLVTMTDPSFAHTKLQCSLMSLLLSLVLSLMSAGDESGPYSDDSFQYLETQLSQAFVSFLWFLQSQGSQSLFGSAILNFSLLCLDSGYGHQFVLR